MRLSTGECLGRESSPEACLKQVRRRTPYHIQRKDTHLKNQSTDDLQSHLDVPLDGNVYKDEQGKPALRVPKKLSPGAKWDPISIFPGVTNSMRSPEEIQRFDKFVLSLAGDMNDHFQPYAMDSKTMTPSLSKTFSGDLSRLSARTGSYMTPCGMSPPVSDDYIHDEWKDPMEEELLTFLIRMTVRRIEPCSIEMNNISSSGFPDWTKGSFYKSQVVKYGIQHASELLDLSATGSLYDLADKFRMVYAYNQTYRSQADKAEVTYVNGMMRVVKSKDRMVYTYPDGVYKLASKSISGSSMVANRIRVALAAAFSGNFFAARCPERLISCYQSDLHSTFKHRGGDDVCSKLNDHITPIVANECSDMKEMDKSVNYLFFKKLVAEMGLTERAAMSMTMMINAPLCAFGDSKDTAGKWRMRGDPFSREKLLAGPNIEGLASGIGLVTYVGKLFGTHQTMRSLCFALPDVIKPGDEIYHTYLILKGRHPLFVVLNQGDDNMIGFADKGMADRYHAYLLTAKEDKRLRCQMEPELPRMFLGLYYFIDPVTMRWEWAPRIESSAVNLLDPERSWGGKMRPFASIGIVHEEEIYGKTGLLSIYRECRSRAFRDHYGINFDAVVRAEYALAELQLRSPGSDARFGMSDFNMDELLFMENPDRRFYGKVDIDNVRPELVARVTGMLPPEAWESMTDLIYDPNTPRPNPFTVPRNCSGVTQFQDHLNRIRHDMGFV